MKDVSPSVLVKRLDMQVRNILRKTDIYSLDAKVRNNIETMYKALAEARIYANDYEYSDTREEQLKNAHMAKKLLVKARKNILAASEHNVFEPADVAQLSVQAEAITDRLE